MGMDDGLGHGGGPTRVRLALLVVPVCLGEITHVAWMMDRDCETINS
jgi:hypothetical protein